MTAKLSTMNLPDSIKGTIDTVTSIQDDKQLALFVDNTDNQVIVNSNSDRNALFSNSFKAYDLWPRFDRSSLPKRCAIEEYTGKTIRSRKLVDTLDKDSYQGVINIHPAIIKDKDGQEHFCWPGDAEDKVEKALMRLASKGNIVKIKGQDYSSCAVMFSLNELSNELKAVKQTMSLDQIKDALDILQGSTMDINYQITKDGTDEIENYETKMNYLSSLHYAGTKGRKRDTKCVAILNPLMNQKIASLEFRGYYYDRAQGFKRSLSRWMMLRLYHQFRYAGMGRVYHVSLISTMHKFGKIDLSEDVGDRLVALRRDLTTTMKDFVNSDVITSYEIENKKDESTGKIIDYVYTLYPSEQFCQEILTLNKQAKKIANKAEYYESTESLIQQ
ncbi:replication protein A [Shewanella sp. MBTL60-007]|uniref:replication protein A n=1 Tax=Shewanella sp. MBTL60-007 TaxID=2815911 RepID=UPI001BBD6F9E|nr:replication protein A [Shewanella sp. MBTL60-007]GIU20858.1 hypothetical protein TUM3792_20990 [Shewanella sp. MBTL60-007]